VQDWAKKLKKLWPESLSKVCSLPASGWEGTNFTYMAGKTKNHETEGNILSLKNVNSLRQSSLPPKKT
jgi:hypothetical protein